MRKNTIPIAIPIAIILLTSIGQPAHAGWLDSLNKVYDRKERLAIATEIYFTQVNEFDSVKTFSLFNELSAIGKEKNDPGLKAYAQLVVARYYAKGAVKNEKLAVSYFDEALKITLAADLTAIEAEVYHQMGWFYYWLKKYAYAFEYFLKANNMIKKIGYKNYPAAGKHLYDIGFMYYDFTNFTKAKEYLLESVKYRTPIEKDMIDHYNTVGLVYRELHEHDSAIFYFNKTIELAKEFRDTVWTGIATGNVAYIYYFQKKYDEALPMFLMDYEISRKYKDWGSLTSALTSISFIYIRQKKVKEAAETLSILDSVIGKIDKAPTLMSYYHAKAKFYSLTKDFAKAYQYLDSAWTHYGQFVRRNDAQGIMQAEQKVEVEKHLADIKLLETERDKQRLQRNTVIAGAILLVIIAFQFINRLRVRQKRNLEMLADARTQLKHYIESIREKNRLIEDFKLEIAKVNTVVPVWESHPEQEEIIHKLQHSTILTDDDWDEFRHLFDKAHKGFFAKVKLSYPNFTNAEIRLLALTKLNLSRKEMAQMLGISPDSIKKTRQRIKRKLNLEEDETLDELVLKL